MRCSIVEKGNAMPDVREKLVELLCEAHSKATDAEAFADATYAQQLEMEADHLIANGVTIQRWIPVEERLPEMLYDYTYDYFGETCDIYRSKPVLASDGKEVCTAEWVRFSEGEILMEVSRLDGERIEPTHWMPLPEPPKEDEDD